MSTDEEGKAASETQSIYIHGKILMNTSVLSTKPLSRSAYIF